MPTTNHNQSWARWYQHVESARLKRRANNGHNMGIRVHLDEPEGIMDVPASELPPGEQAAIDASAPRRLLASLILFLVALLTWISRGTARASSRIQAAPAKKLPARGAPRR